MSARLLLASALTLLPETAAACASCISSPYGDRTFNLGYLGLLVMPFAVAAGVGGVLGYVHFRRRVQAGRIAPPRGATAQHGRPERPGGLGGRPEPPMDADSQSTPFEETT